jgi:glutathione-specific gamma-glutamylcyclotransferase
LRSEADHAWGVCYEVASQEVDNVLSYLDYREKGGYTRAEVDIFTNDSTDEPHLRNVLLYTATEENPEFLGPAPMESIADQIFRSIGPSGKNSEYLLELAKALKLLGIHDEHVFELEAKVQKLHDESSSA